MEPLRLRSMTEAEFRTFRSRLIPGYAADKVRAGTWQADEAEARSAEQVDALLPGGLSTPGMLLLAAENPGGELLGTVWVGLDHPRPGDAWVYDIEILPQHRGKGYGRALLGAAEEESARRGAGAIGLNVFGSNLAARSLYKTSGYAIMSMQLSKPLGQ